jgi:hypothetical protein
MDLKDKDGDRALPNGIFRCRISAIDMSYIVSVYDDNIRKTIFMGRYTDLSIANKQLDEYKSKTRKVIKKTYLTY